MKTYFPLILGFAVFVAGCTVQETNTATAVDSRSGVQTNTKFLDHMHEHADKLDDINFALDDGDLERASIPAFWMSKHQSLDRIPRKWQTYVIGMRAAAQEVEYATDLDTARAASKRITEQCQGCHTAAGIETALN
ncbi:MAG: hypothetical protein OEW73_07405 [Gammaproteobacteria bacterium]|nr:hypothetical protein [Gammaproteobacteria bacterium]MDH5240594.1 hypothetical protein [Gammaproteobacteria bacterium]MDH5260831.1 hypothetical protein [Gammaproteobacteria bacterium]MDH5582805.1 hypothetical protein [Gammaproteobacteria bacterium]